MPLIEAALAFAITMLALSLIVSSFVEIIHRFFKLREAGLKYMLDQLFEQVLAKYAKPLVDKIEPEVRRDVQAALAKDEKSRDKNEKLLAEIGSDAAKITQAAYERVRDSFVERMRANRVPVGLKADPQLAVMPKADKSPAWWLNPGRMWGGLHVTALTPTDFMERLGSHELGDAVKGSTSVSGAAELLNKSLKQKFEAAVNDGKSAPEAAAEVAKFVTDEFARIDLAKAIKDAADEAGSAAANAVDTALTDIAQKFEGFGKDAAVYFEGRARFMSVVVAIVLAFAVHVDAIDLFKTYLRDPNARSKVIEQAQAITAQYDAAQKNIKALEAISPPSTATADAAKAQVEKLKKDTLEAIDKTNETVKSFAGLGAPLGWTDDRWSKAGMFELIWTCTKVKDDIMPARWKLGRECEVIQPPPPAQGQPAPAKRDKLERGVDYLVWFGLPSDVSVIFYLFLGGLLIGLGSPFWYDAVIGLTNIRSMASGKGASAPGQTAPGASSRPAVPDTPQPVTPVGAFQASTKAKK